MVEIPVLNSYLSLLGWFMQLKCPFVFACKHFSNFSHCHYNLLYIYFVCTSILYVHIFLYVHAFCMYIYFVCTCILYVHVFCMYTYFYVFCTYFYVFCMYRYFVCTCILYVFCMYIYFVCTCILYVHVFCMYLLSHLLIARCDIGVQISVRPYVCTFLRSYVNIYVEV